MKPVCFNNYWPPSDPLHKPLLFKQAEIWKTAVVIHHGGQSRLEQGITTGFHRHLQTEGTSHVLGRSPTLSHSSWPSKDSYHSDFYLPSPFKYLSSFLSIEGCKRQTLPHQCLLLTFWHLEVWDVNVERVGFLCCFFSFLLAYFCYLLSPNHSICASSRRWHWGTRKQFLD